MCWLFIWIGLRMKVVGRLRIHSRFNMKRSRCFVGRGIACWVLLCMKGPRRVGITGPFVGGMTSSISSMMIKSPWLKNSVAEMHTSSSTEKSNNDWTIICTNHPKLCQIFLFKRNCFFFVIYNQIISWIQLIECFWVRLSSCKSILYSI